MNYSYKNDLDNLINKFCIHWKWEMQRQPRRTRREPKTTVEAAQVTMVVTAQVMAQETATAAQVTMVVVARTAAGDAAVADTVTAVHAACTRMRSGTRCTSPKFRTN